MNNGKRLRRRPLYLRVLERYLRAQLTATTLGLRRWRAPVSPNSRVLVWPPAATADELGDVVARVQCLFPRTDLKHPIVVAARSSAEPGAVSIKGGSTALPPATSARLAIKFAVGRNEWRTAAREADIWLVWRLLHSRSLSLAFRRPEFYLIDPTLYLSTEDTEWRKFHERHHDAQFRCDLAARSSRNFESFLARHRARVVNICGNGPGLGQFASDESAATIICNGTVMRPDLVRRLRPAAIPVNSPFYFGPSQLARTFMEHITRWAHEFDTYVFVPEGVEYFSAAVNYPGLADRLIGLRSVRELVVPSPERRDVPFTNNIATSMMIPIALSLSPSQIRFWGCDGRKPEQHTEWSHLPGVQPDLTGTARAHPAWFRDHWMAAVWHDDMYVTHCRTMETLVDLAERRGVEVVSASPSLIPVLQSRPRPAAV